MSNVARGLESLAVGDLALYPVVTLLGARQVGKTTLARSIASSWKGPTHVFDLEDIRDLNRLIDIPMALDSLTGLVVIDEVQRMPELFEYLRVLADRQPLPARFLLLGSAQPDVVKGVSESLAGRVSLLNLWPFSLAELGAGATDSLWLRGGFPRAFLAKTDAESLRWRDNFIATYLQRDLPALGVRTPPVTMQRLWTMLSHQHGQVLQVATLARALDVKEATIRRHVDILDGTFVLRRLNPWHANLKKRQVKRPKIYLTDCGLLHALLRIGTNTELLSHPIVGMSWEGFAMTQVLHHLDVPARDTWFWATHGGAELDLLVTSGGRFRGYEFKRTSTPQVTKSMHIAMQDLALETLTVVSPGRHDHALAPCVRARGLDNLVV